MVDTKSRPWDETFVKLVEDGIFPKVLYRCLLFGYPRTGKSRLPFTMFVKCERVTFHRQQPVDDLIGGMALKDGRTVWLDGPAVRAMREGRVIVFDEIDRHSAEQYSALLALLDDPAGITLPTGERVNAVPGYGVVATTNELPSQLADALYDRFDIHLRADTLAKGLQERLGPLAKPAHAAMLRGGSTEKGYHHWRRPGSVNLFIVAAKLRQHGLADAQIAEAIGLHGQEATDFLTALAT